MKLYDNSEPFRQTYDLIPRTGRNYAYVVVRRPVEAWALWFCVQWMSLQCLF